MTEREWQRLENTMRVVVEQQAKFETNFYGFEKRFSAADRRMDRFERLAERVIRAGERRMAKAEAETAELKATLQSFLRALRRSAANGKSNP